MLKDQTEGQRFHSIFQQLRLCDRVKDGSGILFLQKKRYSVHPDSGVRKK